MSNYITIGVSRQAVNDRIDAAIKLAPTNEHDRTFYGFVVEFKGWPLMQPESLASTTHNYYMARKVEQEFFPFLLMFKNDFTFEAISLGRVIITDEQLQTLVPSDWPFAEGRTFEQYCKNITEVGGIKYATMGTWSNYPLASGNPENQDDFWRFFDYFGEANTLIYDEWIKILYPNGITIDNEINPDTIINPDQVAI